MKRRAFTLIELMIVCAVLGIAFYYFLPATIHLKLQQQRSQMILEELGALNKAFVLIKQELAKSTRIINHDMSRVILDNDGLIAFEKGGKALVAGNNYLPLPGRVKIYDLQPISARSFSTQINTGADSIRVIWRLEEKK